jgi:hypothetical protein
VADPSTQCKCLEISEGVMRKSIRCLDEED